MEPKSCRAAWQHMSEIHGAQPVRNFVQVLDMSDYVVETDLFPEAALEAYSDWNLEREITEEQKRYLSDVRGGKQGDYREGMRRKIDNVVDCLTKFPASKRAVISTCSHSTPDHTSDEDAKCLRELQMYLDEDDRLSATVFLRAQATLIFPKNIHFIGSLMSEVAGRLPKKPALGTLFYLATVLVPDRR